MGNQASTQDLSMADEVNAKYFEIIERENVILKSDNVTLTKKMESAQSEIRGLQKDRSVLKSKLYGLQDRIELLENKIKESGDLSPIQKVSHKRKRPQPSIVSPEHTQTEQTEQTEPGEPKPDSAFSMTLRNTKRRLYGPSQMLILE
jgi:predicted  nucleic acid-binding Zn-ribbon protein